MKSRAVCHTSLGIFWRGGACVGGASVLKCLPREALQQFDVCIIICVQ